MRLVSFFGLHFCTLLLALYFPFCTSPIIPFGVIFRPLRLTTTASGGGCVSFSDSSNSSSCSSSASSSSTTAFSIWLTSIRNKVVLYPPAYYQSPFHKSVDESIQMFCRYPIAFPSNFTPIVFSNFTPIRGSLVPLHYYFRSQSDGLNSSMNNSWV